MSTWLSYALATVFFWGVYGVLIHTGRGYMPMNNPGEVANAGIKAFFWVGMAYFVVAVLGPMAVLKMRGATMNFTSLGITWSFVVGVAGAMGALYLVLSLGAAAAPVAKGGGGFGASAAAAVMPIVFALAPIVNTITAMLKHPPEDGMKSIPWQFIAGCVLAATGAYLVSAYAPSNRGPAPSHAAAK
jgi:hypothetical protein